jgi:hypothetical protein
MNVFIKDILRAVSGFMRVKSRRRLLFLVLLGLLAFSEFMLSGLVRRTFVFYSISEGATVVEDRLLSRSYSRETDVRRYLEEALLGPVGPGLAPLFPRETRLNSLLYRDGVVYADLNESAALPFDEGGEVLGNFLTLYNGIRRNFSFVKDVRFFIDGNQAFFDDFQRLYIAENEKQAKTQ